MKPSDSSKLKPGDSPKLKSNDLSTLNLVISAVQQNPTEVDRLEGYVDAILSETQSGPLTEALALVKRSVRHVNQQVADFLSPDDARAELRKFATGHHAEATGVEKVVYDVMKSSMSVRR